MPLITTRAGNSATSFGGLGAFSIVPELGNFVAIATSFVNTPQFGITFSSIPSVYTSLQLRFRLSTGAENSGRIYFNEDETHANYNTASLQGNGATVYFERGTTTSDVYYDNTGNAANFTVGVIDIMDYANTNKYKTVSSWSGWANNTPQAVQMIFAPMWKNTNAINTITIKPNVGNNYKAGSTIALYGIKGN